MNLSKRSGLHAMAVNPLFISSLSSGLLKDRIRKEKIFFEEQVWGAKHFLIIPQWPLEAAEGY